VKAWTEPEESRGEERRGGREETTERDDLLRPILHLLQSHRILHIIIRSVTCVFVEEE